MRPIVKPALRLIWRDATTLQLGVTPDRAVLLRGVDPVALALLRSLDGSRTWADVTTAAHKGGPSSASMLEALDLAGALDDHVAVASDDPLAGERGELSLRFHRPGAAADVLARRACAHVVVEGTGPVAAGVAAALTASGVGRVTTTDLLEPKAPAPRATVVVICPAADGESARVRGVHLHAAGVTHLPAYVCETTGVIGPLVLPGHSCCLHCVFLHRCDRDPGWPVVASQLLGPRGAPAVLARSAVVCATVAALASGQVLGWLDGRPPDAASPHETSPHETTPPETTPAETVIPTIGATLEVAPAGWPVRRRRWDVHPECACA